MTMTKHKLDELDSGKVHYLRRSSEAPLDAAESSGGLSSEGGGGHDGFDGGWEARLARVELEAQRTREDVREIRSDIKAILVKVENSVAQIPHLATKEQFSTLPSKQFITVNTLAVFVAALTLAGVFIGVLTHIGALFSQQ